MNNAFLIQHISALSAPLQPVPTAIAPRLTPLSGIHAVLFDVYGTLFISGSGDISLAGALDNQQAARSALTAAGFSGDLAQAGTRASTLLLQAIQQTHDARRKQGIGCPEVDIRDEWQRVLEVLHDECLIDGTISPEAVLRVSLEYEFRVNPVWPMPGMLETVRALREKQMRLGIVSNAQFYTLLMFPALLGHSHVELGFTPELCAWSFQKLEAKPSPNLFQDILTRLRENYGVMPENTLYVGNDMLNDIWTASQWGLKTALFAGDQRSLRLREHDSRCAGFQPDLIVTDLNQLPLELRRG